jgi:subtilisin family serine protease
MAKLDPGLKYLAAASPDALGDLAAESAFGVDATTVGQPMARVLVETGEGTGEGLAALGFIPRTQAGAVLTGDLPIDRIPDLESVPGLIRAEVSRVLAPELDRALPASQVDAVHAGPPPRGGAGVLVGIIDSGIDYLHEGFLNADGSGTRILRIWDQRLLPKTGEHNPAGFNFGVEYTQADINAALALPNPLVKVRHLDIPPFHGTHVSGITAGNGQPVSASGGQVQFLGVAPEAELIVVANTRGRAQNERGLGDSADTLDAVNYILARASELGRPVAINQSQGDNIGPHDGTSLLEVGIASLIAGPSRVLVKSAGNEGRNNRHAQGALAANQTQDVKVAVGANMPSIVIDFWYPGADRIGLAITPPGAGAVKTPVMLPLFSNTVVLSNGNTAFVDADLNDPGNHDNRTFVVLEPGSGLTVQGGIWTFHLSGASIADGRWHAWIQRNTVAQFQAPFVSRASTISIPGTSTAVITAGSFVSNGASTGSINGALSDFSSRGPTRDGRQAPTLAAPGEELTSCLPAAQGSFGGMSGTSMAAPMVTGVAALMLEKTPLATAVDIRACLEQSAVLDADTGPAPGNDWGAGKLDAQGAVGCI